MHLNVIGRWIWLLIVYCCSYENEQIHGYIVYYYLQFFIFSCFFFFFFFHEYSYHNILYYHLILLCYYVYKAMADIVLYKKSFDVI